MAEKKVFVTVGTTKFEKLIETVSSDEVLDVLYSLGFTFVQFQVGLGEYSKKTHKNVKLNYQMFFEDFAAEINKYDLIISHAGAGSCLEVLQSKKPLIVVINETLMDNHQEELAAQLADSGYVYYCTTQTLRNTLLDKNLNELKTYPTRDKKLFSNYLDKCTGFI